MTPTDLPTLYSVKDAAEKLGRNPRTLYRWIKAGKLHPIRLVGEWRVPHVELQRLMGAEVHEGPAVLLDASET